jgi:hypothetical protein
MHGGAGAVGGSSQVDSGGELAHALATVTTLHKMRERANCGPPICGRKVSRRLGQCGDPNGVGSRMYVSCSNGSILRAAAFGFMRGVQGVARGSGSSARSEALPSMQQPPFFKQVIKTFQKRLIAFFNAFMPFLPQIPDPFVLLSPFSSAICTSRLP